MTTTDTKIFLVDDDFFCLNLYAQQIANAGYYDISTFSDGATCLENLSQKPAVVFLDLHMDDMSGEEVLLHIKNLSTEVYVIMLSSQNDLKHALKLLQLGAYDYVLKGDEDMEKIRLILSRIHAEEELKQAQAEVAKQREVIEQQNKALQYQHKRIQESIKAGLRIQQIILPPEAQCEALLKDYFILYQPKDIVSGDFYWVEEIAGKRVVACIDCTGHGVSGAFMTLIAYQILQKLILEQGLQNPAEILELLDTETRKALKQENTRLDMGMDIALLVIDQPQDNNIQLAFVGAKSNLYFLTPDSTEVAKIESTKNSVGSIFQTKEKFINQSFSLPTGSLLYMCTDGFCHQNNAEGKKIGKKRFFELLIENRHQTLPTQKALLWQAFEAHRENEVQRDDVLVMGIRI